VLRLLALALTLIALSVAPPAFADEADNFTCRQRELSDALSALDDLMNAQIGEGLRAANRPGRVCDQACLQRALQNAVGRSYLHPYTLVPHARFRKAIDALAIDRCHLRFRDTIYGARDYDKPWLYPFHGRIIFVSDSIRVSGLTIGLDKFEHFIREGLAHWRNVHLRGLDVTSTLQREWGGPRKEFAWTEHGLKGLTLTGVLSYADVAAGYWGFRFWSDLLSPAGPRALVRFDRAAGRYVPSRPFTFADYVNDAWDESVNCSTFDTKVGQDVAAALARRSTGCPIRADSSMAELPDASLYVNPDSLGRMHPTVCFGLSKHNLISFESS
jgi:hypothetical protein